MRVASALAAAACAFTVAVAPAGAERSVGKDMHDARYCEILELRGAPPDAKVVIWNTLGLNECPERWWDGLDPQAIAAERGASLVILNGPRHFLMDSSRARTGAVREFAGERLRRVATIPIESPADLQRIPYAERTIARVNTWHWRAGRRVFELLAPDGRTYLMQSYARIADPDLDRSKLAAVGRRLDLPRGWRYRVRKLKSPLTLRARGGATIIQDDLRNTYQRLPRRGGGERRRVELTGTTRTVGSPAPGTLDDRGMIEGTPFGTGALRLLATFGEGATMTGEFTIRTKRGAVFGTVDTTYTITGNEIEFTGTADLTGGTRRYRGIAGEDLEVTDRNTLDGQNGRLTLEGHVRF